MLYCFMTRTVSVFRGYGRWLVFGNSCTDIATWGARMDQVQACEYRGTAPFTDFRTQAIGKRYKSLSHVRVTQLSNTSSHSILRQRLKTTVNRNLYHTWSHMPKTQRRYHTSPPSLPTNPSKPRRDSHHYKAHKHSQHLSPSYSQDSTSGSPFALPYPQYRSTHHPRPNHPPPRPSSSCPPDS